MLVLTVGKTYVEIDGYASSLAYRELLKMRGIESKFVTAASFNYSVTKSLLELPYRIDDYDVNSRDQFIIIDLSNKDFFPSFVNEESIIELIDHHPGFENYWINKLGKKATIEKIGAVATIIVEKYEQSNLLEKMDKDIAKLLMAAILDNTLNFNAEITTERDKEAYNKLGLITGKLNYSDEYFSECQRWVENNLEESIINDLKYQNENNTLPSIIGQLTIWDIGRIISYKDIIRKIMNNKGNKWIINIISLKDNISYIMCSDEEVKQDINKLFNGEYKEDFIILRPAMLRKEIMRII